MDTTDPDLVLDDQGVCNHCRSYQGARKRLDERLTPGALDDLVARIRRRGTGKAYDCIVGLSGGADSSYLLHVATGLGLRPLAVHLDNGWDSELAIHNIHGLVSKHGLDLVTHVIEWQEFRQLQLSYLRAGVVDIEVLTDHAITAVVHRLAATERVRFILSGNNFATECIMPTTWNYRKADLRNLRDIARRNGGPKIKSLPTASTLRLAMIEYSRGIRSVDLLNYVDYNRKSAIATLQDVYGWRDYGGKHYESFFTRFYQSYILPTKFGIDKRKAHLASMVNAGQMTRDEALEELRSPLYELSQLTEDKAYLIKKFGLSQDEFDAIMAAPPKRHEDFATDAAYALPTLRLVQRALGGAARFRNRSRGGLDRPPVSTEVTTAGAPPDPVP